MNDDGKEKRVAISPNPNAFLGCPTQPNPARPFRLVPKRGSWAAVTLSLSPLPLKKIRLFHRVGHGCPCSCACIITPTPITHPPFPLFLIIILLPLSHTHSLLPSLCTCSNTFAALPFARPLIHSLVHSPLEKDTALHHFSLSHQPKERGK